MKRYVIYLFGLLLVLSSCEKTVDYNIDDDIVKPVVYAFLSDDKVTVHLFRSSSYLYEDEGNQSINDAIIMLYEGKNSLGALTFVSDGVYELTVYPKANAEYSITIDVPGYDSTIVAKTTMPTKVLANLSVTNEQHYVEYVDTVYYTDNLNLVFDDPAGVINYYSYNVDKIMYLDGIEYCEKVIVLESNSWLGDWNQLMFTPFERGYSGGFFNILFHDKYIDGTRYEYDINDLGRYEIKNPDYVHPDQSGFYSADDMFFEVDSTYIVPHFRAVNYDYYMFYCDALGQQNTSLTTSEAYYVYSNVENGFGIFAAYCEVSDTILVHRKVIQE